jgi:hypothetical protein
MNISKKDYSVRTVLMWSVLQHEAPEWLWWWCKKFIKLSAPLLQLLPPSLSNSKVFFSKLSRLVQVETNSAAFGVEAK